MCTRGRTGWVRSVYEFIKYYRDQYPMKVMCRILDVAPIHRELVLKAMIVVVHRRRPRHRDPCRSRHPVQKRFLATPLPRKSPGIEHEPEGELLGVAGPLIAERWKG